MICIGHWGVVKISAYYCGIVTFIDGIQNHIYLFVRKNKDDNESKEFYFLGEINAIGAPEPVKMKKDNKNAFEINYRLDVPVREDIYDYIVEDA